MNSYTLLFYAKKTKGNPELSAIYLRITVKGKRAELSTGQTITPHPGIPKPGNFPEPETRPEPLMSFWTVFG